MATSSNNSSEAFTEAYLEKGTLVIIESFSLFVISGQWVIKLHIGSPGTGALNPENRCRLQNGSTIEKSQRIVGQ
jgi:hypothetical protein